MAVSGRKQTLTRSILQGSDEDMPVCLPCERGGRLVEAGGFCTTCNEHLCQACYNSHRLPKPLANHMLLNKSMMPRVVPLPDDMCTKHTTEQLEYYCKNHDKLECSKCVHINHRTCEDVSYIQDICDDIEETQEFKALYRTLTDIEHDVLQNKGETATNLTDIQININDTKASIHSFRNYLNQQLDKMEEAMCEEADDIGIVDKKAIEKVSEESDNLASKVRSVIYSLDVSRQTQQNMRIFTTMKNTERIIIGWQNQLQTIISKNKIRQYKFQPERQLQGVTRKGNKLGRLVERNESTQPQGPSMFDQSPDPGVSAKSPDPSAVRQKYMVKIQAATRRLEVTQTDQSSPKGSGTSSKRRLKTPQYTAVKKDERTPQYTERINVKIQPDTRDCWISGSIITGNNMMAIADYNNKCLKLVDLNKKKVINFLSFKHTPWDITRVNMHTLAVTCPDCIYIQLVRVSTSGALTLDRHIKVGEGCFGIRYIDTSGGRLVVSFTDQHQIKVLDMFGTVMKDLSSDALGQTRFSCPLYITISTDGSTLIVSNNGNHTVTGLTLDGEEKFVYRDNDLVFPNGAAVGDGGEIYVCGGSSNNIHVISSKGRKIKVVLGLTDGVVRPESLTYVDSQLFVGSNNNNHVDVYRIQ